MNENNEIMEIMEVETEETTDMVAVEDEGFDEENMELSLGQKAAVAAVVTVGGAILYKKVLKPVGAKIKGWMKKAIVKLADKIESEDQEIVTDLEDIVESEDETK